MVADTSPPPIYEMESLTPICRSGTVGRLPMDGKSRNRAGAYPPLRGDLIKQRPGGHKSLPALAMPRGGRALEFGFIFADKKSLRKRLPAANFARPANSA
jgi:hypothetical protein